MPRKINEKGSRPIKNKSGIVTHQEETVLKTIKPVEPVAEDYYKCCTCGKNTPNSRVIFLIVNHLYIKGTIHFCQFAIIVLKI